ncbi:MAG TPA: adenylate/guanylate cyclase domain-containing protein [Haliangiales bacterium]|nr:adenylate/guanylate cyclase domain-containing protein [Haliangiales bacterium]
MTGKESKIRKNIAPGTSAGGPRPRAKESDTSHDTALSNIRHSLRTPLNQVIGYSEMLQEEAEDLGLDAYVPDLQKIHAAGSQLLALINDNLSQARVESGKLELESLQRDSRTLLDLIIGYSELCQEDADGKEHVTFVADLKKIQNAAKTMLGLLNSVEFLQPLIARAGKSHLGAPPDFAGVMTSIRPLNESIPETQSLAGFILVVDDNEMNRDMLCRRLERQGHTVLEAEDGRKALEILESVKVDLVLLDILMPELDGLQTLELLKANQSHRHTPVIMLSALDELDNVVRCIEIGAEDYLPKPFNPVLLNARINACLEKKRLRDQEQAYLDQLRIEREKSERLLLNVLPKSIADRLKQGESTIADSFPDATVLFADLGDFTKMSSHVPATELVQMLNEIFSKFDWLAELHHLEKIKTIGDAYMAVGGLPTPRPDHAEAVAEMALDMQKVVSRMNTGDGRKFELRIGISSGPVVAGIIGSKKFIYDLWGDTVNIASRMESLGQLGAIQVSAATYEHLKDKYAFERRGKIEVKGKGKMTTFFLTGRKSGAAT